MAAVSLVLAGEDLNSLSSYDIPYMSSLSLEDDAVAFVWIHFGRATSQSAQGTTCTLTGFGRTWELVDDTWAGPTNSRHAWLFRSVGVADTDQLHAAFSNTGAISFIVFEVRGVPLTANGADAVLEVAVAVSQGFSTGPNLSLSDAGEAIGAFLLGDYVTVSPGSGFTEVAENGDSTHSFGTQIEHGYTPDGVVDVVVDAGGTARWGAVAMLLRPVYNVIGMLRVGNGPQLLFTADDFFGGFTWDGQLSTTDDVGAYGALPWTKFGAALLNGGGGQIYVPNGGELGGAVVDLDTPDCRVVVTLGNIGALAGNLSAVILRWQDADNYLAIGRNYYASGQDRLEMLSKVGGVWSLLQSLAISGFAVIDVGAYDDTFTVTIDGDHVATWSSALFPNATRHGVLIQNASGQNHSRIDDVKFWA